MATDWQKIKQDLSCTYGSVYLRCDGYLVYAHMTRHKMKLLIEVYVNGLIRGEWMFFGKESEKDKIGDIARKFYCLALVREQKRAKDYVKTMEKIYGKRECKKRGLYDRNVCAQPWFKTPSAFVSHIKKNNESVEIIDRETHDSELEALKVKNAEPA